MQVIKKHKLLVAIYLIFTLVIVLLSIIKVPYDITSPAYINKIDTVIEIDDSASNSGSFHTVSVYSYERVSVLQYLFALCDRKTTVSKTYQQINLSNVQQRASGTIQKNVSIVNSLIAGYEAAKRYGADCNISYHLEGYIVDRVYNYLSTNTLEIGDIITSINGVSLKDNLIDDALNIVGSTDSYDLVVKRDNEEKSFTITKNDYINSNGNTSYGFGFAGYDYFVIDEAYPSFTINKANTYGPSGGLLQSLMVFNSLYKDVDLTNGLKIVGTGTIDFTGDVGEIGGMYQKVLCAEMSDVDIFIAPVERRQGYDYSYIGISSNNTWMIGNYDSNITATVDNIPYILNGLWYIGDVDTRYMAYGSIIQFYDESTLQDETNFLEGYRAYKTLNNTKMDYVPVATLDDAINYFFTIQNRTDILKKTQNAYNLYLNNNENVSVEEWMERVTR